MSTIHVEIVSAEGAIYSGDAEMIVAPAREGDVGERLGEREHLVARALQRLDAQVERAREHRRQARERELVDDEVLAQRHQPQQRGR